MSAWTLSPEASADRALAILAVLQFLTQFEGTDTVCCIRCLRLTPDTDQDLARDANTVMTFYAASVGQLVHEAYQPPSLPRLGKYLLHTLCECPLTIPHLLHVLTTAVGAAAEVRQAARLLFDAGVARLSDQETTEIVETWQPYRE